MPGEQNFKVFLTFKDDATGKFVKATEDQIASMKKLGLTVKKEGGGAAVDIDKMGQKMDETGRHSRYLGQEIGALAGKIGSIRNMILVWMFALRPLISTIKSSVSAAIEQEDSERRLAAAFAATGAGSKEGAKAIIEQANALQALTGASDNELISASSILATFKLNENQIRRLLPLLVDMTALVRSRSGEEMNLASVAKAVGSAFSSNASRLQYLGITMDETTKKTKDFDSILKAIDKSVSGAAVAMSTTFSGQMKILSATMSDFKESIGNIIIKSPYFVAVIKLMTEEINRQNKSLQESQKNTDNFAQTWKVILATLIGVWTILKGTIAAVLQLARVIDVIIMGIAEFIAKVLLAVDALIIALLSVIPATKGIRENLIRMGDEIESFQQGFSGAKKQIIADINEENKFLLNMGTSAIELYNKIQEGASAAIEAMKTDVKGLVADLDKFQNAAGNQFNAMRTFMESAVTGMRDSMVDGFFKIIKGEFEGLMDVVNAFGDLMLKTILQIAVNAALIKIGLGSFLGFGGGFAHTGGLLMSPLDNFGYGRRKFHDGGEVNATLLKGEGVVNQKGMRSLGVDNLNKLNRGEDVAGGGVVNNYYIQAIDVKSFRDRLEQHGDIYSSASAASVRGNGILRKANQKYTI